MIEDIEFFSGAPEQVLWPVLFDTDIPVEYDNPKQCAKLQNVKLGRNKYTTGKYYGGKHG